MLTWAHNVDSRSNSPVLHSFRSATQPPTSTRWSEPQNCSHRRGLWIKILSMTSLLIPRDFIFGTMLRRIWEKPWPPYFIWAGKDTNTYYWSLMFSLGYLPGSVIYQYQVVAYQAMLRVYIVRNHNFVLITLFNQLLDELNALRVWRHVDVPELIVRDFHPEQVVLAEGTEWCELEKLAHVEVRSWIKEESCLFNIIFRLHVTI